VKTPLPKRQWGFILGLIVLLGSLLRFTGLENQSLWNDELSSWTRSNQPNYSSVIEKGVLSEAHPPGYHTLLYLVIRNGGDSETALRLPSAIFGILSIVMIFFLGRRLYSAEEGLVAAAFMACLWTPVFYSQEARTYSAVLMLSLLATYYWVGLVRYFLGPRKWSWFDGAGYGFSSILLSYFHYFGLMLVCLQGLALGLSVISKPRRFSHAFFVYFPVILAFLP
jgi:uncharacterized membrane protein